MFRFFAITIVAAALSGAAIHLFAAPISGVAVHTAWWWPIEENSTWSGDKWPRGKLVVARIANNQVTRRDTIFNIDKGLAEYPALDYSGTRIAFFRWGLFLKNRADNLEYQVVSTGKHYLSVINIDGTGLTNLIEVSAPCKTTPSGGSSQDNASEGNAVIDWPAGPWIYYEKPTKTYEIRRIKYDGTGDQTVCSMGSEIRRWEISWDAKWCAWQSRGTRVFNGGCAFPGLGSSAGVTACNASISCAGGFINHYYGGHTLMVTTKWDHSNNSLIVSSGTDPYCTISPSCMYLGYAQHTVEQIQQWIHDTLFLSCGNADLIRNAVNSEKWALRQIGWAGQAQDLVKGTNQVAVNWKDRQAINISHTPPPPNCDWPYAWVPPHHSTCADAGDLWIDWGGQAGVGKYEAEDGTLKTITPTEGTLTYIPMLPPPQTQVSAPADKPALSAISIAAKKNAVRIDFADKNSHALMVRALDGRMVLSLWGNGYIELPTTGMNPGVYVVSVTDTHRTAQRVFKMSIL